MTLYEINDALMRALEIDPETGELLNPDAVEQLTLARDEKIENIALWIKNLESDATEIKAEIKSLTERAKAKENRAKSLREYLAFSLEGQKFETPRVAVTYRKSTTVETQPELVEWLQQNHDEYLRWKEPEVDKTELKKALQKGEEIPFATLVEKNNIQIK